MSEDASSEGAARADGSWHVPDGVGEDAALGRCTRMGIGAHSDDLEFMAFHGVWACYDRADAWFGGVIVADGAGSARSGPYADVSEARMREIRAAEQREAADAGRYSFARQLGRPSADVRSPAGQDAAAETLRAMLDRARPGTVYAHNPADKHPTHVAVFRATLRALRALPAAACPAQVYGCEVWRDLDWLAEPDRVELDLSGGDALARRLNACFRSQIAGGKRYDRAVEGRRAAHATFARSHEVDAPTAVTLAVDLAPLLRDPSLAPEAFVDALIDRFREEARQAFENARGAPSGR